MNPIVMSLGFLSCALLLSDRALYAAEPPRKAEAKNVRLISYLDLGPNGTGTQILMQRKTINGVERKFLYIGGIGQKGLGFHVVDVTNPRSPRIVKQMPKSQPNTSDGKIQLFGDILITRNETRVRRTGGEGPAGIRLYDIADPTNPKEISYFYTGGTGVHRFYWEGGPYVHVAGGADGFVRGPDGLFGRIYMIVDISDPKSPKEVSRWWIPGMWKGGGENPNWGKEETYNNHEVHALGNRTYNAWWDAGLVILDISDIKKPRFISRLDWSPPYGGATHTVLPLPQRKLLIITDEEVHDNCKGPLKLIWIVDITDETRPLPLSTFPRPQGDYCQRGKRFGPHSVHKNWKGSKIDDQVIYATYFNAGLRIVDISEPFRPEEIGYYVPAPPLGAKEQFVQTDDVYVDTEGYIYLSDRLHGGLWIVQFTGRTKRGK
ncbi:MAG: hypothetical protein HY694_03985 [Deltaproteobacteria bacterium]|nr:hypothetical protein [Deltaproteobacteria bacterium]